uniref:G-protein coupled receptors family 1 profile domain-containing protein n=1 Tax=Poecilia latipinna TaxID=48699 RepID=A0A3B3U330_9TELE
MNNVSTISLFFLSGLNETSRNHRSALFFLSLMCYCITVLVNVCLILIIILDNELHEPMYILLCAFCMNALYGTAGFYPKFLSDLLSPVHVISYSGCLLQAQVLYTFACSDLSILSLMAYDRYLAICRPLEYHSVMSKQRVMKLTSFFWLTSAFIVALNLFLTYKLKLCRPYINRLFCVNWSIVSLACFPSETSINEIVANITILICILCGVFIVWSYMYIIKRCASSMENRAKFMQTCVPHLISLSTFILTILIDIINNRRSSADLLCSPYLNRLICLNWSIVMLACFPAETIPNSIIGNITILIYGLHGVVIGWSYLFLIKTCVGSIENRRKFMQTCVPHLISLFTFLVTIFFDVIYIRFETKNLPPTLKHFVSIEFLILPPLMNPLIYGFKLTQIRKKIMSVVTMKMK